MKQPAVYIMCNQRNGTLYVGMTTHLARRVYEHKMGAVEGFTKKYGLKRLVYYELHDTIPGAAQRELQLKKWDRLWKLRIIEEMNPEWDDLYESLI